MRKKEFDRLEVLLGVQSGRLRVCRKGTSVPQFWRLQPSEAGRVSFQLRTADDISTLRGHDETSRTRKIHMIEKR